MCRKNRVKNLRVCVCHLMQSIFSFGEKNQKNKEETNRMLKNEGTFVLLLIYCQVHVCVVYSIVMTK